MSPTRAVPMFALAGALALGAAVGSGITFLAVRGDRAQSWLSAEPGDAIGARVAEILGRADPLQRVTELSGLLSTLDPKAGPSLAKAFDAARVDVGDPDLVLLAMWWARVDPKAALAWVSAKGSVGSGAAIAAIFRTWAHSDPQVAIGTARMLASQMHGDLALDAAVVGWDESGKPGLIEFLAQFPEGDLQRLADSLARRRVVALGPADAFRWVESLAAMPRFQEVIAERVASAAAESAEGAPIAAAWATPRVRSDDRLSNFPRRIATRWVAHDPKAAMAWLSTLPAGADRHDGVTEAFRDWMSYDRPAASAWIDSTEIQPWNESALSFYLRVLSRERPKEAMEQTQRISNPELREDTMVLVARAWIRTDRAAASAWLAQPGIPERVRRVTEMVSANERPRGSGPARTNTGSAPATPRG